MQEDQLRTRGKSSKARTFKQNTSNRYYASTDPSNSRTQSNLLKHEQTHPIAAVQTPAAPRARSTHEAAVRHRTGHATVDALVHLSDDVASHGLIIPQNDFGNGIFYYFLFCTGPARLRLPRTHQLVPATSDFWQKNRFWAFFVANSKVVAKTF